jgi:putative peptidoglycan lipid II flippase
MKSLSSRWTSAPDSNAVSARSKQATSPILRASTLVMLGLGISAVTEVVKDAVIAFRYGTSVEADAFFAAIAAPWILATVIWSATNVSLVPLFSSLINGVADGARSLAGKVALALALVVGLISLPAYLLAPQVMAVLAPGFTGEASQLAIWMFRLVLPMVVLAAIGGVGLAYLNSRKSFLYPALNNAIRNFTIIALMLLPLAGRTAWFLPLSILIGVAVQNFMVWPAVYIPTGKEIRKVSWRDGQIRHALRLVTLPLAGLTINHSITLIEQILATFLRTGSVATLNFSTRIPIGFASIIGAGFSTGSLPYFSRLANDGDIETLHYALRSTLKATILIAAPSMAIFVVLSESAVRVLFERGAFDSGDAEQVGSVMAVYGLTLAAACLNPVLLGVLYAYQDTKTPVYHMVLTKVLNVTLAFLLLRPLGLAGLGVASVVAVYFSITRLLWLIGRRIGGIFDRTLAGFIIKVAFSAIAAGVVAWAADFWINSGGLPSSFWVRLAGLALSAVCGGMAFLLTARVLGIRVWKDVIRAQFFRGEDYAISGDPDKNAG